MLKLPKHINLTIEHNPQAVYHETALQWLEGDGHVDATHIDPADRAAIIETGEIWVITWYPDTPVGSYRVAASTLERALAVINDGTWQ